MAPINSKRPGAAFTLRRKLKRGVAAFGGATLLASSVGVVAPALAVEVPGDLQAAYGAIESPSTGTTAPFTISGTTREILSSAMTNDQIKYSTAIPGVRIFAQWREGNDDQPKSYSPVYTTVSDENGNFALEMDPYVDDFGRVRYFEAQPQSDVASVNGSKLGDLDWQLAGREQVRIWAELPEGSQYSLVNQYGSTWMPVRDIADNSVSGTWDAGRHTLSGVYFNYVKNTDYVTRLPEDQWATSGEGSNAGNGLDGSVSGTVFWNSRTPNGASTFQSAAILSDVGIAGPGDTRLAGQEIVGSYLSDEAVTAIETYAANNFGGKQLRGSDWTAEDEAALQQWISDQITAAAPLPNGAPWIAETVRTTTNAEGEYRLYFKGIYGNHYDSRGIVPADRFHTLAGSWDEGSWLNGNLRSKHINLDWMVVEPVNVPDSIGVQSPWQFQRWSQYKGDVASDWQNYQWNNVTGLIMPLNDYISVANIILTPEAIVFDVNNYDAQLYPAEVGDTANTTANGLLVADGLTYKIVWTDPAGNVVQTYDSLVPEGFSLPNAPLTVPADLAEGTLYTATLYAVTAGGGDTPIASDNFLAVVPKKLELGSIYDAYEASAAVDTTSGTPDPADDITVSNYSATGLPEGLTIDESGVISGTPTTPAPTP